MSAEQGSVRRITERAKRIGTGRHCVACLDAGVPDWCDGLVEEYELLTERKISQIIPDHEPLLVHGSEPVNKQTVIKAALRALAVRGYGLVKLSCTCSHDPQAPHPEPDCPVHGINTVR